MKASLKIQVAVTDDRDKVVYEAENMQNWAEPSDVDIYCRLFDALSDIQFNVVESSGQEIDDFL